MSFYEATLAIKLDVAKEEREELIKEIKSFIGDEESKEIKGIEELGVRSFAYEAEKSKEGFFVTINFQTDPSRVQEIRKFLRAKAQVIRLMITRRKTLPQSGTDEQKTTRKRKGGKESGQP